jgi:hypothetical protein
VPSDGVLGRLADTFAGVLGDIAATPFVRLLGLVIVAMVVMTWVATAWWARADLRRRTSDPAVPYLASAAVILATPLLFPLALLGYVVVRPPRTVADERRLRLEEELDRLEADDPWPLRCPACGTVTEEGWLRCPSCRERIAYQCTACDRPMGTDWVVCAWCAEPVERPDEVAAATAVVPLRGGTLRRGVRPALPSASPTPEPEAVPAAIVAAAARAGAVVGAATVSATAAADRYAPTVAAARERAVTAANRAAAALKAVMAGPEDLAQADGRHEEADGIDGVPDGPGARPRPQASVVRPADEPVQDGYPRPATHRGRHAAHRAKRPPAVPAGASGLRRD